MSRNLKPKSSRKPIKKSDRRVRRTREVLGDALIALMKEKPFAEITVQHVLDRADVSRSTFYSHYRDKDDLFLSDVEDFFEVMSTMLARRGESSSRVAPVRELFAHVGEWHEFHTVLIKAGKVRDFMELGQGYFARSIEQRLAGLEPASSARSTERKVAAQMAAGALLSLMSWWLTHGRRESPSQMDDVYHQMIWCGIVGSRARAANP